MGNFLGGKRSSIFISGIFFVSRLILILSLPMQGLQSYGDFWNFFPLAGLGRPFWDAWVEFPPLFPFLSRGIYLLSGGREHAYIYLSVIFFSAIQAGSVYLFQKIAERAWGKDAGLHRTVVYAFLTVGLFYGWTYFDCLAVFLTLLGIYFVMESKQISSGIVLGLGGLTKWFPVLILPAIWKWLGWKKALQQVVSALLIIILVWGALFIASPTMTKASLISQGAKGSWESVWAIVDGNLNTGNFDPAVNRLDPATASIPSGNPSLISPWLTLVIFVGIGLALFWKAKVHTIQQFIAFSGITFLLFFLWSPGYSPQWVLYLIPLVLLSFESSRSILVGLVILLVNLLEWPLLLSRGLFQYLPALITLRTCIYIIVALLFASGVFKDDYSQKEGIG